MEKDKCPICLERKKLTAVSDGCQHLYCPSCIKTFFNHQLVNRIDEVKCPFPGCKGQIKNDEKFLGKKLYQQYLATRKLPERIQCADIGCNGYIEFNKNTYACEKCNKKICKLCLEYHNDQSCQDPRELASRREKAKKYVRCPLCKVFIERRGGCSNINCTNCNKSYDEDEIRSGIEVKLRGWELFLIKSLRIITWKQFFWTKILFQSIGLFLLCMIMLTIAHTTSLYEKDKVKYCMTETNFENKFTMLKELKDGNQFIDYLNQTVGQKFRDDVKNLVLEKMDTKFNKQIQDEMDEIIFEHVDNNFGKQFHSKIENQILYRMVNELVNMCESIISEDKEGKYWKYIKGRVNSPREIIEIVGFSLIPTGCLIISEIISNRRQLLR